MLKIVTDNLGYEFINGEEKVFFPLKIVNRRNIVIENQTKLVNEYINYKGKEYIASIKTVEGLYARGNRAFNRLPFNDQ